MFRNRKVSAGFFVVLSWGAVVGLPASAQPTLKLTDGSGDIVTIGSTGTVTFGGSCTPTTCTTSSTTVSPGSVTWSGTIGAFQVINLNGSSKPTLAPPQIDVRLMGPSGQQGALATFSAGGTLTIEWSDTSFNGDGSANMNETTGLCGSSSSSCIVGSVSVTYASYVDNSNSLFGMGTTVGTIGPITAMGSESLTGAGPTANPYSMTEVETITMGPNARLYGNNDSLTVTPVGPTANCVSITAVEGVAITPMTLTGSGGFGGPYTFSATGLPTGLMISSSGTISGTPMESGTFPYTVTVEDVDGHTGTVDCSVTVAPPTSPQQLGKDDTATIGFWHNKNGQALINSLNGGSSSTLLGNWLTTNFPNLYGSYGLTNNASVAALFLDFFGVSGQKTQAQILATALACYATSSTMAGGNVAASQGFNVTSAGICGDSFNVGSDGSAIGLLNNTSYTILFLLQTANNLSPFTAAEANAFNDIFSNINQKGDI